MKVISDLELKFNRMASHVEKRTRDIDTREVAKEINDRYPDKTPITDKASPLLIAKWEHFLRGGRVIHAMEAAELFIKEGLPIPAELSWLVIEAMRLWENKNKLQLKKDYADISLDWNLFLMAVLTKVLNMPVPDAAEVVEKMNCIDGGPFTSQSKERFVELYRKRRGKKLRNYAEKIAE